MQHPNYCTGACPGNIDVCPRCGDVVCDTHVVASLCLACQDDADELGVEPGDLMAWDAQEEEVA